MPAGLWLGLVLMVACGDNGSPTTVRTVQSPQSTGGDADCHKKPTTTPSGLRIRDINCGEGERAVVGSDIEVHYVARLENGEKVDDSRDRNTPFQFRVGSGTVIAGWDEGVAGMRVGGVRELTVPPDLAYGNAGQPPAIPPDATVIFEIELLEIL
jgi:FKBP-type peptidyl-prolyl cis-trans isomerase